MARQAGGQPEGAALPGNTRYPDLAAHQPHQLTGNGQPQTGSTKTAGTRAVGLLERLEYAPLGFWRNADTGIDHLDPDQAGRLAILDGPGLQRNRARFGELDGIGGVIQQGLAQALGIAKQALRQRIGFNADAQALGAGPLLDHRSHPLDDFLDRQGRRLQFQLPGFEFGEIENIVDQPQQLLARLIDVLHPLELVRRQRIVPEQVGHADNGIERRPQFVADVRQELRFHLPQANGRVPGPGQLVGQPLLVADIAGEQGETPTAVGRLDFQG